MRLLITRPAEDAAPLVKILEAEGHSCVLSPLLNIVTEVKAAQALSTYKIKDIQALIVTSANGVRAFASADKRRSFKVMAVGDASARAAFDAGFKLVETASGDVETLAKLIKDECNPDQGTFLHIAGSRVAGDLKKLLEQERFVYERVVLYHADKAAQLNEAVAKEIREGKIDGVLLYSPRTAASFVELVAKAGLENYTKNMVAYGLSAAVGSKIKTVTWKDVKIAARPDQDALLACIKKTKDETMTTPKKEDASKTDNKTAGSKPEPKVIDVKAETVKVEKAKKPSTQMPPKPDVKKATDPVEKALKDKRANGPVKKGSLKTKLLVATAVIVAGVGAGAYFTQDMWVPKAKAQIVDILGLETVKVTPDPRLDLFAHRLDALENVKPAQDIDISPLLEQINGLGTALETVKSEISTIEITNGDTAKLEEFKILADRLENANKVGNEDLSGLKAENARLVQLVTELNNRLTDIEAAQLMQRGASDNAQALVASLSALREVLRTSSAYGAELQILTALAQGDVTLEENLEILRPAAITGILSMTALEGEFEGAAINIVRAIAIPQSAGWVEETVKNITSLVSIRRAPGETAGDGPLGIVARAEENLRAGDLTQAVGELETLEGKPLEAAKVWINLAQARLSADRTLSLMQAHILSLLNNTGEQS